MSWVTVVWSISSGACLTLAFLQFIVWWKDRAARANLAFAVGAVAVGVFAGLELALMRAQTPAQFDTVARWIHVPAWVLIVSIVAFVRLYLNAGRRWLAWTVVAVRTLALILNFVLSPNINYREVTALRHMPFLGEPVSVPVGVPNPWMLVAQSSLLLLVIFVVDATITVWRRGNRRQALVVGGSIVLLVLVASGQAVAMTWGILATPLTVSLFYLIFVAAMAYELSYDLIHAAQLNRQLQASEATLRESEQRFRIVADAAPVLIWMSGVDKLCTFFNKRWLEFTGRSLEQEMGNGWAEGVHRDDLQKCLKTYTEAFDARKPFVMQYRLRRNDGEYRWISDDGVPRYDANGTFTGYIGSCVDVTDLITKEQALHDSNERIDLATKAAGLIVWTWDIPRDEIWLSEKDRALFGLSPSEKLTAERIRSVVHPDDRELVRQLVEKSLKTDEELEGEYRIVLGDGRVRWVTRRGRIEFDGVGNPVCERGVLMDITDVVKNREALHEFEERVVLAAKAAHLGVWELDIATNELWMSDSARNLFQFDSETRLVGASLQDRVHPEDRARRDSAVKRAIETGGEYQIEYRVLLPDGTLRWFAGRGRCVTGEKDKGPRLIGVSMDVTSQKQTQELFRLATEASPSGMLLVDEQGRIVLVNAHIEELFGYQRDELVGKLIEILVPERFVAGHPAHRARFFAAPEPRALGAGRDLFARRKDGSEFPVEIAVNPVRTPEGTLVLATVIDITERKQAEEKFRLAVEASPSGILLVDQTGQIVLVNSQVEELFGYGREELIGQSVEILVPERFAGAHPEHRAKFFAAPAARAMGAGRELFARRKDGSEFPVEIGLNPIQSPEGMLILAAVVDISERKRAEEKFRMAVEASPSGILLVNQTGQIVLVNSQIEELSGYGREELIGQSVEILVPERFAGAHPEHRATFFAAPAARAMGAGRELFARRKDGSEFPVEIGLNPIQSPEGMLVLAAIVDISARLDAEEETRRRREQVELLSRVSLLGEMTASLAHELNQPLAAIVNNATAAMQYLEQGRLDREKLRDILTDVAGDGRRAHDIMRNVRGAIKKGSAIYGRINLNDVAKAVAHMVQLDAAAQLCKLEMSLARDLPAIEGDPTQIQQVLINLVRNALDAMRDTPPDRRIVEIATKPNGDGTIGVGVRDYGSGISETTRERLFEQFFTTKDDGLGMGLAIVRSIIEAHGGTVAAENANGGGARFYFRLPINEGVSQ